MKALKYILSASISLAFLTACNDSFLEKYPETELNEEAFFQTPEDMAIYLNNSYKDLSYSSDDLYSDNIGGYTASNEVHSMLHGTINENNVGGWSKSEDKDWYNLRKANVLLANAHKVKGEQTEIDHYIGVARFFRANFYFKMLKRYGAAPWYDRPLSTDDPDLYKGMDSRELIAEKIMDDLEFAANHIKPIDSRTYINQWAAYSLLARFALHEGTFRKYHTEINLANTASAFLEKAVWATSEIMKAGFDITGEGPEGYRALFTGDLAGNKEIILYADYDRTLKRGSNTPSVIDWMWHLSRSLADSYLKTDGTPATSDPAYATKTYNEMFESRDPRMAETIMPAGFIKSNETLPTVAKLDYGYLPQLKYYPRTPELNSGYDAGYNDIIIFRYAETLLINAEAKAELGTLKQEDLNATVNKLRRRVGMPDMKIDVATDPVLAAQYPAVSGNLANVILEIRRERRVELACEGLRYDDLMRWKAGKLLEGPAEGVYIPGFGAYDVTGDGEYDIAFLESPDKTAGLTEEEITKLQKVYYLVDKDGREGNIYLSEGNKGNIRFTTERSNPAKFEEPKCYYFPIPFSEIQLNPNLEQPMGWRK
ncbi:RagB/SusD family nutrient uptake outer membrane protein [uncultured Bacteroides sp.]|uniref:RagB/SusD family nutrient uptake outer membrane protein n=1 Tax=uncultured Bacteroides sp. TaxID=162156 RepID=UPI0025ED722F|nr:RagB/SusD family nutrient uptake outer membrane protein [uncultured Bacteroides sp.]